MPVENSRLSGFFRHSVAERRNIVKNLANLTDEQVIQPGIFPGGPTVKVLDPGRRFGIGIRARF